VKRPSSVQRRFLILGLALLTFGLAYYAGVSHKAHRKIPHIHGISISPPSPVPVFELNDHTNAPYDNQRLLGHWSLLMFDPSGTTQPTPALAHLLKVHNRMAIHSELQQSTHYLYLAQSVGASLDNSITQLGKNIYGLQGRQERIQETFLSFGIEAADTDPVLYLIGPQGHLHALFTDGVDAATIAKDIIQLITSTQ
jgi:cytochrome oxidase Cu insertion factor (SCO1/SenC/PrrC family)